MHTVSSRHAFHCTPVLIDRNSQPCTHSTGCPRAPFWTRRCYSSSCSFISCKCLEASKTLLPSSLWASYPRNVGACLSWRASASFWISCCSCQSQQPLYRPLKKLMEEWCPCLGWGLGAESLWKVPSNPSHSRDRQAKVTLWQQKWTMQSSKLTASSVRC